MTNKKYTPKTVAIQTFMLNSIILLAFIIGIFFYIIPEYKKASEQKAAAISELKKSIVLETKGPSYSEFKENIAQIAKDNSGKEASKLDTYTLEILKNFDSTAYKSNFSGRDNEFKTYNEFLIAKNKEIQEQIAEPSNSGVDKSIQRILPEYSSDSTLDDNALTDFKFVNYIESLLDIFKLNSEDSIGIGNLQLLSSLNNNVSTETENESLEGDIYYFPLKLSLTGKKSNIIDFLHYVESVGKISVKDNKVAINNYDQDPDLKDFKSIGRKFIGTKSSDIYNNLVMDIQSIEFAEYIDSSELPSNDNYSFVTFLKQDQGSEKYEIDLNLRFYVRGLPTYKIEEFIKKVHTQYQQLSKKVVKQIQVLEKNKAQLNSSKALVFSNDLKNMNSYLQSLKKEISSGLLAIKTKKGLGDEYEKSKEYETIFGVIQDSINEFNGLQEEEKTIKNK